MPDNSVPNYPDLPASYIPFKLRSVSMSELPGDQVSNAATARAAGGAAGKIPDSVAPERRAPPGILGQRLDPAQFRPDAAYGARRTITTRPSWPPPAVAAQEEDDDAAPRLPRTRNRFGTGWSGRRGPGLPPNPWLAIRLGDPVRAAKGVLHCITIFRRIGEASRPRGTSEPTPDNTSAAAPGVPPDTSR